MIRISLQFQRPGAFRLNVEFETSAHITGLFGPSGAGKSTLIALLAGLERPDQGRIEIGGETLFDSERGGGINVPTHRRRIGVAFQEHRLFPHLSVKSNLLYGRAAGDDAEFRTLVDLLELGPLLTRRIAALSGGERQRTAVGRALLSRPRLLLLDEPLSSLDHRLRQQILPYFQRIRDHSQIPILYVSHDLSELLQLTGHLLILERGGLVGHGAYADLVHDARILPVVHNRGMTNVLTAEVLAHHPDDGVTILALDAARAHQLTVPLTPAPIGARIPIAIQPWDVALAATEVREVSIQNQLPATVTRCTRHESRAIVGVDIGAGVPLIVEVSRRAATTLALAPGRRIVCLFKSHAVRHLA